jgi:hypothetical protein
MENAFVELAQGCSDAALFEKEVLAAFSETIGFDVAYFSVKGLETEPTVSGLPRETIQRAVAGAGTYARELMPVKRAALAARGVAVDTDVLGVSRVRNAHYYNDVAMTVGGGTRSWCTCRFAEASLRPSCSGEPRRVSRVPR